MAAKARKYNLIFRPHFKTHQSAIIGQWFKDLGVNKITVSSVDMASYFIDNGWDDITIAFVFNILETPKLNQLAQKANINILVDSIESIFYLEKTLKENIGVFIKIDLGSERTGLNSEGIVSISTIIDQLSKNPKMDFKGFIAHSGNSYKAINKNEVIDIHNDSLRKLKKLKTIYSSKYSNIIVSIGDTPTNTLAEDFSDIDEIRPGNFVFNDLTQENIGVCSYEDIALIIACPIVSKHAPRSEIVVYCGSSHLSKEYLIDKQGRKIFGKVVYLTENGWSNPIEDVYVSDLYQEHGIIKQIVPFYSKLKLVI